ncbi:type II toxin-antitoxin system RelE/ParE family toxin [Candidatus Gottesmanbacteria bacterium]|nr:type II toxin-antitoxin system RelE/ParE family toxin [Candidatus Gottesmanbacteria bacterium]
MQIFISKKAQKELDKIPDSIAKNITDKLVNLSENPYPTNSKKLEGQDNYRLRIGSFRAIYTIDKKKKEIAILRVANRKTIYR